MEIKVGKIVKYGLLLAFIASIVIIGYSYKKLSNSTNAIKQQQWEDMEKEVASWTDALGKGLDEGIRKTIIVLNLLGFKTIQSCEGHTDWGRPYPWVMISAKDPHLKKLTKKLSEVLEQIRQREEEIQKKYPEFSEGEASRKAEAENTPQSQELNTLYRKMHALNDELNKTSRLKITPLRDLVLEFYKKQPIDPDTMLIVADFNRKIFELYSIGGNWQVMYDKALQADRLKKYQEEIKLFTDFLIDYYFTKPDPL